MINSSRYYLVKTPSQKYSQAEWVKEDVLNKEDISKFNGENFIDD